MSVAAPVFMQFLCSPCIFPVQALQLSFNVDADAGAKPGNLLSDDDKYDLTYLREWRIFYGHSIHSYDHSSGSSLVSKVCQGRPFEREWWNNALLSEVDAYLQPVFPGLSSLPVGAAGPAVQTSLSLLSESGPGF